MPIRKHKNAAFIALPVTADRVLAETPCANCEKTALAKIRGDGWLDIQCDKNSGCGYYEAGFSEPALKDLVQIVLDNPETHLRRASKAQVMDALGLTPEPQSEPKPAPVPAPEPQIEPKPAPVPAPEPQEPSEPAPLPEVEEPSEDEESPGELLDDDFDEFDLMAGA